MRHALWALGLLIGCGGGAGEVSGSFGDHEMAELRTAWFGGPNVLLVEGELDCIDTAWIERNYGDGVPEGTDSDFTALQFTFDGSDVQQGTFAAGGAVRAFGLSKQGEVWSADTGRTGQLVVTFADSDHVEGSFEVGFTTGSVQGTFTADYCRNIDP